MRPASLSAFGEKAAEFTPGLPPHLDRTERTAWNEMTSLQAVHTLLRPEHVGYLPEARDLHLLLIAWQNITQANEARRNAAAEPLPCRNTRTNCRSGRSPSSSKDGPTCYDGREKPVLKQQVQSAPRL